jgi:hypothetical protein
VLKKMRKDLLRKLVYERKRKLVVGPKSKHV